MRSHLSSDKTEKQCSKCGLFKPLADFYKSSNGAGGVGWNCKPCQNAITTENKKLPKYKQAHAASVRRKRDGFDFSPDAYHETYNAQDGCCKICGTFQAVLHVDHNHKNLKFRGLLCGPCNRAIVLLQDDPFRVENVLRYLMRYE